MSTQPPLADPKRSLRPENIAALQEELELRASWGLPDHPSYNAGAAKGGLEFPLNDSSATAGHRYTDVFSDWSHFKDNVEGHPIYSNAHSMLWHKKFINMVHRQSHYFDDYKEKEAKRPIKDTKATRLRAQRAKQMAGRFRLQTAQQDRDRSAGIDVLAPGYKPKMAPKKEKESDADRKKRREKERATTKAAKANAAASAAAANGGSNLDNGLLGFDADIGRKGGKDDTSRSDVAVVSVPAAAIREIPKEEPYKLPVRRGEKPIPGPKIRKK